MKILSLLILVSLALPAMAAKVQKPKDSLPNLALKNYRELSAALASATGVDPTTPEVQSYFSQVVAQLPRTGTLNEFNAQSLIASIGMASTYCKRVIYQDAVLNGHKSGLNLGIDFSKPSSNVTDAQLATLVKNYSNAFLQRDATDLEQKSLSALFKAQAALDQTAMGTRDSVLVVCTGVASSFEFLSN